MVIATPTAPMRTHKNMARARRFLAGGKSMVSSFAFSAAPNASAKNSAFTGAWQRWTSR